jgi:hypothetical protein
MTALTTKATGVCGERRFGKLTRPLKIRASFVLLASCAALLAASASASAKIVHPHVATFSGADAPGGPMGPLLVSDAVDETSGDVYVLESNAFEFGIGVIDEFDENGAYAGVQITGSQTPQGSFAFGVASGLAVDNSLGVSSRDLYVADTEHHVVDKFDSSGGFVCQITATTPSSPEEIGHECNGAAGSATPDGSFAPSGVAVDASGDVFVADSTHAVVDKFTPGGKFISQIASPELSGEIGAIAVDHSDNVYVSKESSPTLEFDSTGAFVGAVDSNPTTGVGVDPATSHVYVGNQLEPPNIGEYSASGELLDEFGAGIVATVPGIAVNGSTGRIYASELQFCTGCGTVVVFGPGIVVPDVTTGAATNVQETSATLTGHVDPDAAHGGGEITGCRFEYVTAAEFAEHPSNPFEGAATAACTPPTSSVATDVSANIATTPGTLYHFRLTATNAEGTGEGDEATFTTIGAPSVLAETATARATTAIVRASINPLGFETACEVEFVSGQDFSEAGYARAARVPCVPADLSASITAKDVSATLSGLSVATSYHYRFVVRNHAGVVDGADATFTTFGVRAFTFETQDKEGKPFTQAGGHPYRLLTNFDLVTTVTEHGEEATDANLKDVHIELPRGLVGNPTATAKCTRDALTNYECGGATQVGVLHVRESGGVQFEVGIYNLAPPAGVPAEFGAKINTAVDVFIDATVRTGGDYGINADVRGVSTGVGVVGATAEFWGVPADPTHDTDRFCPVPGGGTLESNPCSAGGQPLPFLTTPTTCSGPQSATLSVDSWQDPGDFVTAKAAAPAATGCDRLRFTPAVSIQPDTAAADSPSGLHVDLRVPQSENPEGLAESTLEKTVVTLPAGMSVSPSAAGGLQACSQAQIGLDNAAEPTCPDASRVGTVQINTPLLPDPLKGSIYVAEQTNNPFGSLLAIYLTAEADGALIKLAGHIEADPTTGQLTTTFDQSPPLPFGELRVDFFGGSRAALASPEGCGTYSVGTSLSPWSGASAALFSEGFQISSQCVSGFTPTFTAGTVDPHAGRFAPFVLSFSRADTDQELSGLTAALPPGAAAKLVGVPLCSDLDAGAGTCPVASQVGTVQTAAGPGATPILLPGKVYLTGPYKGAPYGLSVVVPAVAGPFNLGTVVVRQALQIDPVDVHVTAISDPFPTILQGIPIRLRRVDVTIDRPNFTFNPTSCEAFSVAGTLTSTSGLSAPVASHFQAANCGELPFKPSFAASTRGPGSKANGASLEVKVAAPRQGPTAATSSAPEANIRRVDVQLPKELPSRLTTLQKACTEQQFAVNPAGCPAESRVGSATARTPILTDPLTGPAYLVSHGGEAFPDLVLILQGSGITVQLTGHTQIKNGITFSHFETVPDEPISSFDLKLPEGKFSVLAAPASLCKTSTVSVRERVTARVHGRKVKVLRTVKRVVAAPLLMPTTITAQNGAVVKQATKIAVAGCAKPKAPKKKNTKRKKASRRSHH